jgi:hypothetical protein
MSVYRLTVSLPDVTGEPREVCNALNWALGLPDFGLLRAGRDEQAGAMTCAFRVIACNPDSLVTRATAALQLAYPGVAVQLKLE